MQKLLYNMHANVGTATVFTELVLLPTCSDDIHQYCITVWTWYGIGVYIHSAVTTGKFTDKLVCTPSGMSCTAIAHTVQL